MPPIRSVILVSVVLASEVRWKICEIGTFLHSHGTYRIFPRAPANSLIPYSCSICSKILALTCLIRDVKKPPCVFTKSLLYRIILYRRDFVKRNFAGYIFRNGSKRVALNVCHNGSGGRDTTQDATAHYGACKVSAHHGYLCKTGLGRNANCQRIIGKLFGKRGAECASICS